MRNPFKRKPKPPEHRWAVVADNSILEGVAFTTAAQAREHADRCGKGYSVIPVDIFYSR